MNQPRWDRIQEVYYAALALPRSERDQFVVNACANDADLLREVTSLLEAAGCSGLLDNPVSNLSCAADDLQGRTIGERYFVERELSRGVMSQVYFARDLRLQNQPVVIKILSQALVQDAHARQKFKQEVEALLRVDHHGIVRVTDTNELIDGRPYIVMPYVDGEMLRLQIPSEGMALERAASILKQIGNALDHIHEKGIFHRDLKPENIIIRSGTDSAVLIDFGIAKVKDSLIASTTTDGASAGTLRYMSPEQLRGEKITAASDIYSMGVVAYEMVTGHRPFNPTSASHLLELQRAGARFRPMQLRENLSATADGAIIRALKFEPRARYQTAGKFADELASALLVIHKPRGPTQKWVKVVGGLMILAVLSYGLYIYFKRHKPPTPRSFTYWLTVQQMRAGQEFKEPFKSNGEETFARDDKFQLSVLSAEPGYFYIFNEGPPESQTNTSFRMIYPSTATNSGLANVGANQTIQSEWFSFRGPPGNENFWIVWAVLPVSQLESAKTEALKQPRGGLTGETLVAVKEFLRMKELEADVTVYHYKATQKAIARGKGDLLVTLAQFKYR